MKNQVSVTENVLQDIHPSSTIPDALSKATERPKPIIRKKYRATVGHRGRLTRENNNERYGSKQVKPVADMNLQLIPIYNKGSSILPTLKSRSIYFTALKSLTVEVRLQYGREGSIHALQRQGPEDSINALRLLSAAFRSLSALSTLKVQCGQDVQFDIAHTEFFFQSFRHLASLSVLTLDIHHSYTISKNSMQALFRSLRYLSSLQVLHLTLSYCQHSYSRIITNLKHLTALTTLEVNVPDSSFISTDFKALRRLHTLKLSPRNIDNNPLNKSSSGYLALGCLSSMTTLSLDFKDHNETDDEHIRQLYESLGNLHLLSSLELVFVKCEKMPSKSIQDLTRALKNLTLLQTLKLDFSSCWKLDDEDVIELFTEINKLTYLQTLDLNFGSCLRISDRSVQRIGTNINKNISVFHINMAWNYKVTDKSLETLSVGIASLTCLKELSVNLSSCYMISDLGIESLLLALKHIKLDGIGGLDFSRCNKISAEYTNKLYEVNKQTK